MPNPPSRIEISIPQASDDGKYYGRYPHGGAIRALAGAATVAAAVSAALFGSVTTTFPNTQNPITGFNGGASVGLDWQDMRSNGGTPGLAYPTGPSDVNDNDGLAFYPTGIISPTKHFSEIKIKKRAGYTPPSSQECECHVGGAVSAHNVRTYEMDFGWNNSLQPVRWEGGLNNFRTDVFTVVSGNFFQVSDGDVVRAVFDSSSGSPVISVYLNGVLQIVLTDTTAGKITSGVPGFGGFYRSGTGVDPTGYCVETWTGGNA